MGHGKSFLLVAAVLLLTSGCGDKKSSGDKAGEGGKATGAAKVPNTARKNSREVRAVFSEFRLRMQQYRVENGEFPANADDSERWPPVLAYGKQHGTLTRPTIWKKLHIKVDPSKLRCGYAVVAGKANDVSTLGTVAKTRFSKLSKVPTTDWFYVLAECDGDGDPKRNAFWLQRSDLRDTLRVDAKH